MLIIAAEGCGGEEYKRKAKSSGARTTWGARLTYLLDEWVVRVCGRLQFVRFIPARTINQERAALGTPCLLLFTARFTRHLYVFIYFTVIILRVSLRIQIKSSLSSGGSDRRVYIADWSEGALLSSDPLDVSLPTTTQKRRDGGSPPSSLLFMTQYRRVV